MRIDLAKIKALAKSSHNVCLGTGITGRHVASNTLILCHCVWRALKAKGISPRDHAAVQKAIGAEEEIVAAPEEKVEPRVEATA